MELQGIFSGMSVSGSGLAAERKRIDLIAKNIANAETVAPPGGRPYRRQEAIFRTVLEGETEVAGGVRVAEVLEDTATALREVHDPSHPFADPATGNVTYSNVNMAYEMVDLISASRAYEANLRASSTYKDMVTQSLRILEA